MYAGFRIHFTVVDSNSPTFLQGFGRILVVDGNECVTDSLVQNPFSWAIWCAKLG